MPDAPLINPPVSGDDDGSDTRDQSQQTRQGSDNTGDTGQGSTNLEAEVEKWKRLARRHEDAVKDLRPKAQRLDEIEAANATELEKAVKAARDEERKAVATGFNRRIAAAEIKAAAGSRFNDPADAVAYLTDELDSFVGNDGEVDSKAVAKAVDALLKAKPYLAASAEPDFDSGPRTGSTGFDMNSLIRRQAGVAS